MIFDNLEFFNVGELEEVKTFSGYALARLPRSVRYEMNSRARFIGRNSTAAEIRFVTDAPFITLHLTTIRNEGVPVLPQVKVMCGNFEHSRHPLQENQISTLNLTPPDFSELNAAALRPKGFAPCVWRVVCSSPSLVYCGIDTFGYEVRPPKDCEKPGFCCLCYGSSITNSTMDGWPSIMAQRLGIDVQNLGLAGACQVEPEMADYIASKSDWDGVILELGINILGMPEQEFAERVDYLLAAVTKAHPGKPVIMLTIFPSVNRAALRQNPESGLAPNDMAFNIILRNAYKKYKDAGNNMYLIEGDTILDDTSCWSTDKLHPRIYGNAVMGLNMANALSGIIG